ncbi:helix-turn-helix domain-containing protein [Priestia sp. OVS21]|nr:helix-turn-helix domain-containing protein [Priestia sp. OVS21]
MLDVLQRYSAKYTGVSFLTKTNIGKLVGKSRFTIIRVCKRLEDLGIIKQFDMKRKSDMKQTASAIVIQPVIIENATQEPPKMQHQDTLHKTTTNNKVIRKERANLQQDNITLPIPAHIPADFANLVTSYYRDTKTVFELWGRIRLAYIHSNVDRPLEELTDIAVNAFRESIAAIKLRRLKKGNSLDSLRGYLYGTTRKMLFDVSTRANGAYYVKDFAEIIG